MSLAHLGLLRRRAYLDRTSMRPNHHISQVTTDNPLGPVASSTSDATGAGRGRSMLAFRSVVSVLLRGWETFLYTLKAGPAGGRLRRPSSRRQRHDGHRGTGLTLHPEES